VPACNCKKNSWIKGETQLHKRNIKRIKTSKVSLY
jgi:hypothetical protein